MITRLVSCVIIGDTSRSRATPRSLTDIAVRRSRTVNVGQAPRHVEQMNWQGKDGGRLVQRRVETDAAFLLVSENIISTHVGRQHIHLAKQLIGYGPIDKKNSQNKLFLIATAREYFSEIHHLVGIVGVHAEPLAAVIKLPAARCRAKRMAHTFPLDRFHCSSAAGPK